MNRTTKPVPKQLVRSAWRIGFSETTAEHAENPVYQEEYAAQLIMARRADLHPKGRIHLRRPVDRPSLFPCSHAADHTFRGSCDTPSPALTFTDGTRRRRDCPPHRRTVRYNYRRRRSRRCPYRGGLLQPDLSEDECDAASIPRHLRGASHDYAQGKEVLAPFQAHAPASPAGSSTLVTTKCVGRSGRRFLSTNKV